MGGPQPSTLGGAHPPRAQLAVAIFVPFWGCGQSCATSSLAESGVCTSVPRCWGGQGGREDPVGGVRGEATSLRSPSAGVGAACTRLPFKSWVLKYPWQPGTVPGGILGL